MRMSVLSFRFVTVGLPWVFSLVSHHFSFSFSSPGPFGIAFIFSPRGPQQLIFSLSSHRTSWGRKSDHPCTIHDYILLCPLHTKCTLLSLLLDRAFHRITLIFFFLPMPPHVLVDFVVLPPGHGRSVTDFSVWDAHEAQLRCPDDVSGDIGGCSARRVLKPKFYKPTQTMVTANHPLQVKFLQ